MKATPSSANDFPKASSPNAIALGHLNFNIWTLRGHKLCIYPCVLFSDNKCMVSFQQQIVVIPMPFSNSPTWTQCPAFPLYSDTNFPELVQTQVKGSVPKDHPHFRCQSQVLGPQTTCTWLQTQRFALPSLCAVLSHSVVSDSLWPHGPQPTRLLCPWGFSRQEHWSGLPYPPPRDLPKPGIKPRSPSLQTDSLPSEPPGKPITLSQVW